MQARAHFVDITLPFSERLPSWPGDVPVRVVQTKDVSVVSELRMSSHAGTHLDAPLHFVSGGATVDQLPLDALIGPAWLADMGDAAIVTAQSLAEAGIPKNVARLLLRTQNSARMSLRLEARHDRLPFDASFIALDRSAGEWLLDRGIRLVGLDGPSIDPFGTTDFPVHHLLLRAGAVIVENLLLQDVEPGPYRLICLPLLYEGGDGAPVRAVLESLE